MRPGGPLAATGDMTLPGVYYGIVTQNKDPDNLNRIKVRLPWLDKGDVDQAHWAQLATPMEGDKFGFYTLPDIDDRDTAEALRGVEIWVPRSAMPPPPPGILALSGLAESGKCAAATRGLAAIRGWSRWARGGCWRSLTGEMR